MNECKPRFLGVAVMHWARPMAAELRDSRSERRQGSSSDISSVRRLESAGAIRRLVDAVDGRRAKNGARNIKASTAVYRRLPTHASRPSTTVYRLPSTAVYRRLPA